MKNKFTIFAFVSAVAGIALGVGLLIFGLKMDTGAEPAGTAEAALIVEDEGRDELLVPEKLQQNNSAAVVAQAVYVCVGSVFALVSTAAAGLALVKMAKEEEEGQA